MDKLLEWVLHTKYELAWCQQCGEIVKGIQPSAQYKLEPQATTNLQMSGA